MADGIWTKAVKFWGGQPMPLQQAWAMFDPGRFYGASRNVGVRGVRGWMFA